MFCKPIIAVVFLLEYVTGIMVPCERPVQKLYISSEISEDQLQFNIPPSKLSLYEPQHPTASTLLCLESAIADFETSLDNYLATCRKTVSHLLRQMLRLIAISTFRLVQLDDQTSRM